MTERTHLNAEELEILSPRERAGRFMLVRGHHMGDLINAGTVQDYLELYEERLEAARRELAAARLPQYIVDSITEYRRLAAIPPEKFGGDRNLALLNMAAYIGESVARLPSPPAAQEKSE